MHVPHRLGVCMYSISHLKIPIPYKLDQIHLQLIARKETSRTSMISVAKSERVRSDGHKKMFVFISGHFAEVVEAKTIEFVWRLVFRWIIFG